MRSPRNTAARVVLYSAIVCGAAVTAVPLYWLIRSSFMSMGEIFLFPPLLWSRNMRWSNYSQAWTSVSFFRFMLNTSFITAASVLGVVLTSSLCGYGFARFRFPLKRFWFALIMTALMLPYAVYLIPMFLVWVKLGALDTYLPFIVPLWFGGGSSTSF